MSGQFRLINSIVRGLEITRETVHIYIKTLSLRHNSFYIRYVSRNTDHTKTQLTNRSSLYYNVDQLLVAKPRGGLE